MKRINGLRFVKKAMPGMEDITAEAYELSEDGKGSTTRKYVDTNDGEFWYWEGYDTYRAKFGKANREVGIKIQALLDAAK